MDKKAGSLIAVVDRDGRIATDKAMIEQIVTEELENIFSGKWSHIFSHRGEQLIKELAAKDKEGWNEWIGNPANPVLHGEKICATVSEQEISDIIRKWKIQRAPRVDGVTVTMLKYTGPALVTLMTDLVNNILTEE